MTRAVYLDYNATAPVRPAVIKAMAEALEEFGNPSSVHRFGRLARRAVEEVRERVAALVGARSAGVVFTSGGTEANNLAVMGTKRERVIVSAIEHDSIIAAAHDCEIFPAGPDGVVELAALEDLLARDPRPALVCLMLANNETGVIQPVAAAAEIAHAHGALIHCDAVQAAGKVPVNMEELGVDLLSVSAHKLGGPKGIGALAVADQVTLSPTLRGGGQERGRRAGTENVAGIVGFGVATDLAGHDLERFAGLVRLRDRLEKRLRELTLETTVFGATAPRLPNTSCCTMPGVPSETQIMALDLAGVAVSAGAACSSGKVESSRVLRAMGADEEIAGCALRVSLGWNSREEDIDRLVAAWGELYASKRAGALGLPAA
ncbi:MAG: cysteine desulfurase family protein [Alphaproteobacteria bacterium]